MQPARTTNAWLLVLLANAAAILFFRFFITVDGPSHVLHASLLETPWHVPHHLAHGIAYNTQALHGSLGDHVMCVLLQFSTPEQAHVRFAAMVSGAVVLAVFAFLRAHGTRTSPAILWLAPLTFNFVLLMGLFHFLLGVALSIGAVAWWKRQRPGSLLRWIGFIMGGLLAWSTHRSAPVVVCAFFLVSFLSERFSRPVARAQRRSWIVSLSIVVVALLMALLAAEHIVRPIPTLLPQELPTFDEALLLRPLLLLDPDSETWIVRAIGILMLIPVGAAAWARVTMRRKWCPEDISLALFAFFQLIAWLGNAPQGGQLLIAERSQWLALLSLVMWLTAMAGAQRGLVTKLITVPALLALPLQVIRMIQAEGELFKLQPLHQLAIEAGEALASGSLVLPVRTERNAMLQHLEAYIAIRHSGILLAVGRKTPIIDATGKADASLGRIAYDPYWPIRHWRSGIPPAVDQILFITSDMERAVDRHPWPMLLKDRYRLTFDNGYARIYTAFMKEANGR